LTTINSFANYFQSNYQYFVQELVHDGPIMDIKFDPKFGRLASVGNGFAQVSEMLTTDGSEQLFNQVRTY